MQVVGKDDREVVLNYLNDENGTCALLDKSAPGYLSGILSRPKSGLGVRLEKGHGDMMFEQLLARLNENSRHVQSNMDETRIVMDSIYRDAFLFGVATAYNICNTASDRDAILKYLVEETNHMFAFSAPLMHIGTLGNLLFVEKCIKSNYFMPISSTYI